MFIFNTSLDGKCCFMPLFIRQDMAKYGNERRLHIPGGSAYVKMFPDLQSQGSIEFLLIWRPFIQIPFIQL